MRQIKFRAFHPKTQKYLVHDWEIGDGDDGYICNDENGELVYSGGLIWEQFTGLLANNGREIYEGDVLSKKWKCEVFFSKSKAAYMVKFNNNPWRNESILLSDYLTKRKIAMMSEENEDCEIVGNINENPELLTNA